MKVPLSLAAQPLEFGVCGRRRRIVHLEPAAADWLTLARKLKADLPVPSVSRRRWLRAMRDHLAFKAWPQDVLRHTAASHLLALRKDAAAVALELGNSPQVLLTHYRELVTREQTAEFWAVSHDARQPKAVAVQQFQA